LGLAWYVLGLGHYLIGQLNTAKKYIEKGLRIHRETEILFWASYYYLVSIQKG
jgi:hypothetical protein